MAIPTKKPVSQPRSSTFWLFPILLLGAALRFYHNTTIALWHDEAFSALYIRYPWGEMMHRIGLDVHPPLYYWLLRLWSYVLGSGLLSLRGFSILFGVLTIYAGYLFVKKAFGNEKLAVLAALLLAVNPFQTQYAVEARMYTLGTFLVLLSSYFLLKALESNKTRDWILYSVTVAACLYTHYYLFFSVASQGLYFIYYIWKQKNWTWKGWGSFVLSIVLFAPWIPTLLTQISRVEKSYWIPTPDRWSVPSTIWKMLFGGQGNDHLTLAVITLITLVIFYFFFTKSAPANRWIVLLSLTVPFIGAVLLSFKQAIYLDRYFVFASLFFSILIAAVIYLVPKFSTRKLLSWVFVIFSLLMFFKNWQDLGSGDKPGMLPASKFINDNAFERDHIYVGSSFIYFTFRYYNQTPIAPKLISDGPLESIPHFSGTAILNPDDLILTDTIFNHPEVKKDDRVWLLWTTGFGGSKPNVPGTWQKIDEKTYADTPGFKGDIIVTEYHVS